MGRTHFVQEGVMQFIILHCKRFEITWRFLSFSTAGNYLLSVKSDQILQMQHLLRPARGSGWVTGGMEGSSDSLINDKSKQKKIKAENGHKEEQRSVLLPLLRYAHLKHKEKTCEAKLALFILKRRCG